MAERVKLLDVVALTADRPTDHLRRGQVGTAVEALADDVFLVEFSDDQGRTYALASVPAGELLVLHYRPAAAAS